ncbi:Helitron helicase [Phytophthora megakarya]|uniref:Helitron helicase n=1 Tax=Phytophthora megakarya TaxID=4795 RepID=A0A225UPA4_9STRA|nr:Helitron helicase [Phytophthora megakarya]
MLCLAEPEFAGYFDTYRWDKKSKWWVQSKKYVPSLGRIVHVSPQDPERFYLRRLLCYRREPTSFEDLRTIDNVKYPTFHEAARTAGYLENDREWEERLLEASYERMPFQLHQLFGTTLVYSLPGSPLELWERFKSDLSEDFQRELGMDADDRKVEFKTLQSLDNILCVNSKTLENYGLPVLEDYREEADANEQNTGGLVNQEINAYPLVGDHGSNGYKIESEPTGHFRPSHKWNCEIVLAREYCLLSSFKRDSNHVTDWRTNSALDASDSTQAT